MTKDQLETAIRICEKQIELMTNECLRPNYQLKMREYSSRIGGCVLALNYYKEKISELEAETSKPGPGRPRKKEVDHG